MSIKRDDIDARKDFSDIASGRRLPPVHPGEILRDEFLTPMKISVCELANAIKVPRTRVNDIVLGTPGDHNRYRDSPRAILRHIIRVMDQPSDALRSGRGRSYPTASDRAGNLTPRGLTETDEPA